MAHSFIYDNTAFICDGDPRGGLVRIKKKGGPDSDVIVGEIEIPYDELARFMAEQTRRRIIETLEQASDQDVLTGRWNRD